MMKRYQKYMDDIHPSSELHDRLLELNAPKKTVHWQRYGAMAAALLLVVGLGAMGLSRAGVDVPAIAEVDQQTPDIAPEPAGPDVSVEPGTNGGYEVTGEDERMVAYYMLPAIIYNEQTNAISGDYSLAPPGALSREATVDDVAAMVGSQEMMKFHLLWGGELSWSGTLWFLEDGTPCGAALHAEGDGVALTVELLAGSKVPSCIVYPDDSYETTQFSGVEITALKTQGWDGWERCVVSCFADGIGYKLTISGASEGRMESMCSHFARWAIVEGFELRAVSMEGARLVIPTPSYEVGEPHYEPNYED